MFLAPAFFKDSYFMVFTVYMYDMWPFICCCVVAAAAAPLLGGF